MKLKSILWPSFLLLCMAAAGFAVAMRSGSPKPPMRGFTLFMTQTTYPSNGEPFLSATKIRQHKADGRWKLQTTYANGRVDLSYGEPGRGVFAVDERNEKLEYLSDSSTRPLADIDWTKQPGFAGEEMILGYKTYRIRKENDGNYSEFYMCPELQGYPLKYVTSGLRTKTVWETTQVIYAEPDFEQTPDLPVSMKRFDEKTRP